MAAMIEYVCTAQHDRREEPSVTTWRSGLERPVRRSGSGDDGFVMTTARVPSDHPSRGFVGVFRNGCTDRVRVHREA